jgi:acyl carrier protein
MTRTEMQQTIIAALGRVAPEVNAATLATDKPIRDQVDLDSVDYLNFVIELHTQMGVDIPESDYEKLTSIDAAIDYLAAKIGSTSIRN